MLVTLILSHQSSICSSPDIVRSDCLHTTLKVLSLSNAYPFLKLIIHFHNAAVMLNDPYFVNSMIFRIAFRKKNIALVSHMLFDKNH